MKKTVAMLLIAALTAALPLSAPAEAPSEPDAPLPEIIQSPAEEYELPPEPGAEESIAIDVGGEVVVLGFDSSPEYSSVSGGLVQASFYAYGSDGDTLYELYIIFPETAQEGMVITPNYAALTGEESSVVLIVSNQQQEKYYFSSLMDGDVYPAGSDFSVTLDSLTEQDGARTYAGRLSATLIALDMASGEVADSLTLPETPFRFTLGSSEQLRHADPLPTEIPGDMRKV